MSIPPGGEPSVALIRYQVAYGLKPAWGWKDFFSFFVPFLFHIICPKSLVLQFIQPLFVA